MPPMYGPRATQVSRSLEALGGHGWQTTVVCLAPRRGGPHWPDGVAPEPIESVSLERVPSREESFAARVLFRLLPMLRGIPDDKRLWVPAAVRACERIVARDEAVGIISFAQPWSDHLVGLRAHRRTRLPWVAHFSDPWVDSPYAKGARWQERLSRRMEHDVVREADAVVFVSEQTRDLVMRKYPAEWRGKAHVVPHGFDSRIRPASSARRSGLPLRIVYTGRFYRGLRTPSAFLRALARLHRAESLAGRLDVLLMGPTVREYEAEAVALGLGSCVRFAGRHSAAEARQAAEDADVLLTIDAPSDGPAVFLPSKLVEYLLFRKPILGLTPAHGASADLLCRAGCPIAPPDDEAAIVSAVDDLLRRAAAGRLCVSEAFDAVAAEFDISRTTERLHQVLVQTFEREH
jgi:glycosyltransferase involved in cell wall biosynthesis